MRGRRLRIFAIALTVLVLSAPAFAADKPNVVLMLADNLGYGDLSSYNGGIRGGMRTPRIDQLASEGMRLTQFLVEPGCTPSRSALMTGRYSIRSGLSLIIAPGAGGGLQDDEFTLGEMFKSVGTTPPTSANGISDRRHKASRRIRVSINGW